MKVVTEVPSMVEMKGEQCLLRDCVPRQAVLHRVKVTAQRDLQQLRDQCLYHH